jgi:hypothetical protein
MNSGLSKVYTDLRVTCLEVDWMDSLAHTGIL